MYTHSVNFKTDYGLEAHETEELLEACEEYAPGSTVTDLDAETAGYPRSYVSVRVQTDLDPFELESAFDGLPHVEAVEIESSSDEDELYDEEREEDW